MDVQAEDVQDQGARQGRRFCFTLNNYTDEEVKQICDLELGELVRAGIAAREVAESGTRHIQGYIEVRRRYRFNGLRDAIPALARAALFVSRGSRKQNFVYCSKQQDVFWQVGDAGGSSSRTDLCEIRSQIDAGVSEMAIAQSKFPQWCQYRRAFAEYRALAGGDGGLRLNLHVSVYYGIPGSGKTRAAYEMGGDSLYVWPGGKWFDGYNGERTVLFDDFGPGVIEYRFFLRLLDIYPIRTEVKGGYVWFRPERIIITTNLLIGDWFPENDLNPLHRRIHEFKNF